MLKQEALLRITQGVMKFQNQVFPSQREMFERLRHRQNPLALFVTCADARVVPNLKRLGLVTPRVREAFERLGIIQFEDADPEAQDRALGLA